MRKFEIIVREPSGHLCRAGVYADSQQEAEIAYQGKVVHVYDLGEVQFHKTYYLDLNEDDKENLDRMIWGEDYKKHHANVAR